MRPNIGVNTQIRGCNLRAIRLGASGGIVMLSIAGLLLTPEQMSLSIGAYIPQIALAKKTKSAVSSKNIGNSNSQKLKVALKEGETADIFEEYFEIIDEDGNINLASSKQENIPKKSSASKSPKNSTQLSAKATSKYAKKVSTTQPTTIKTTKTTKTTKVSKPPTLPKSAEKPQKNPIPSTPAAITPTAIGIV